jgi:hypothetical protein
MPSLRRIAASVHTRIPRSPSRAPRPRIRFVTSVAIIGFVGLIAFIGAGNALTGINAAGLASAMQSQASRSIPWLQTKGVAEVALPAAALAYRMEFGHGMDEDLDAHGDEVAAWLISWQAAYTRGEPWARGMAQR